MSYDLETRLKFALYSSIVLQIIVLITSSITAIVSFKNPENGYQDLKGCFLYVEGEFVSESGTSYFVPKVTNSIACNAVKTISSIQAVSSLIVILVLIWMAFTNVKRSAILFYVLFGIGLFCGFIGFFASCMYSVGLENTRTATRGIDSLVDYVSGNVKPIATGEKTSWVACAGWFVYVAIELFCYKSDQSVNKVV